jgi:hypothetical protein
MNFINKIENQADITANYEQIERKMKSRKKTNQQKFEAN